METIEIIVTVASLGITIEILINYKSSKIIHLFKILYNYAKKHIPKIKLKRFNKTKRE